MADFPQNFHIPQIKLRLKFPEKSGEKYLRISLEIRILHNEI